MKPFRFAMPVLLVLSIGALSGCAQFTARSSASQPLSTLVDSTRDSRQADDRQPLHFPAAVAILFVPGPHDAVPETALRHAAGRLKEQLLANPKYVSSVNVVSPDEMRSKLSLDNIRTLYGAEIAVILRYRQDQRSRQGGPGGLADATLVGAFIVPSVKTTTSTLVDGLIVHIPSDALIFQESGSDNHSVYSTSYGVASTLADESIKGIVAATEDFGTAVSGTLSKFDRFDLAHAVPVSRLTTEDEGKAADPQSADRWKTVNVFKVGGAGSLDGLSLALLAPFALWRVAAARRSLGRGKRFLQNSGITTIGHKGPSTKSTMTPRDRSSLPTTAAG